MKDAIHLLTYDIGTTGAKTCLFKLGKNLELMDAEVVGYPLITTPDGGSEQRVDDWWKAICQGSHAVLFRENCPKEKIAAISFCCQMQALVLVDKAGQAVRNPMGYMDGRAGRAGPKVCAKVLMSTRVICQGSRRPRIGPENCAPGRQRIWGLQRELRSLVGEGTSR